MTTLDDKAVGRVMFNLGYISGAIIGIDCEPSIKDQLQSSLAQIATDITKEDQGDVTSEGQAFCVTCGHAWKTGPDCWRCRNLPDMPEVFPGGTCAAWTPAGDRA